jgi:hypothetical protein
MTGTHGWPPHSAYTSSEGECREFHNEMGPHQHEGLTEDEVPRDHFTEGEVWPKERLGP